MGLTDNTSMENFDTTADLLINLKLMYIFYADESGFSKGGKLEPEQPITVFAGILLDRTKLFKAIKTFDSILVSINKDIDNKIKELKFNDIKQGKFPYSKNFPTVDDKTNLLQNIITKFEEEISFKVFYCAIDDKSFFDAKKRKASIYRGINPSISGCCLLCHQPYRTVSTK